MGKLSKLNKRNWNEFSEQEKLATENSVLLVGLLYKMCQISLVKKAEKEDEINILNQDEVNETIKCSAQILANIP